MTSLSCRRKLFQTHVGFAIGAPSKLPYWIQTTSLARLGSNARATSRCSSMPIPTSSRIGEIFRDKSHDALIDALVVAGLRQFLRRDVEHMGEERIVRRRVVERGQEHNLVVAVELVEAMR